MFCTGQNICASFILFSRSRMKCCILTSCRYSITLKVIEYDVELVELNSRDMINQFSYLILWGQLLEDYISTSCSN